jgi:MYXO-CTERM domain-containing protein
MTLATALLLSLPAMAGYGDVDEEGRPSWAERDMHIWTNAVRVEPEAWESEYNSGGCSFDNFLPAEQVRLPPLAHDPGLNEAARYHSQNMVDRGFFAHDEPGGDTFSERIAKFYDTAYAGENIAYGYPDTKGVVTQGWMCSDGHRANIMLDGYQELGTGYVNEGTPHYTQNFGGGGRNWSLGVQMGSHYPGTANHEATFIADWYNADAPVAFLAVVDGEPYDMELTWGDDNQGVYQVEVAPEAVACHQYYFWFEQADGTTGMFPEEGSFTYGESCDDANGWVAGHIELAGGGGSGGGSGGGTGGVDGVDEEGNPLSAGAPKLVGCSSLSSTTPTGALALLAGLLGLPALRRRR